VTAQWDPRRFHLHDYGVDQELAESFVGFSAICYPVVAYKLGNCFYPENMTHSRACEKDSEGMTMGKKYAPHDGNGKTRDLTLTCVRRIGVSTMSLA
jgi:hypothetical protein